MPGRAQSRLRPSHWAWPGLGFWGPAWPGFWPEAEAGTSLVTHIQEMFKLMDGDGAFLPQKDMVPIVNHVDGGDVLQG